MQSTYSSLVDSNSVPAVTVNGERALGTGDFTGTALRGALRNEFTETLFIGGGVG